METLLDGRRSPLENLSSNLGILYAIVRFGWQQSEGDRQRLGAAANFLVVSNFALDANLTAFRWLTHSRSFSTILTYSEPVPTSSCRLLLASTCFY